MTDHLKSHNNIDTHNPGIESLNEALKVFFFVLKWVMVIAVIFFLFSGVTVIKQHQVGLILRFGKITGSVGKQVLKPGLHWALPYPIHEVIKIDAARIRSLRVENFWSKESVTDILNQERGGQQRSGKTILNPGVDGYALTGDINILHFMWEARYKLKDPLNYFLNLAQPLEINNNDKQDTRTIDPIESSASSFIKTALTNAVLRQAGQMNIDNILKQEQEEFKIRVEKTAQQTLDKMQTGIALERLDLVRISVPGAVQQSFDLVLQAEMQKSEKENQAQAYRNKEIHQAEGNKAQILGQARVYRKKTVSSAQADAGYITNLLKRYSKDKDKLDVYLRQYYIETLDQVLSGIHSKYIIRTNESQNSKLWIILGKDPQKNEREKK